MAKTRKNRSRKATRKDKKQKKTRKGSSWTDAVKRVYEELKRKNPNVKLGAAMKEASRRKNAGTL
jgi:hypothetical protein